MRDSGVCATLPGSCTLRRLRAMAVKKLPGESRRRGLGWAPALSGVTLLIGALSVAAPAAAQDVRLRAIGPDHARGMAAAVVVESGTLVHTALLFPESADGQLHGAGDAGAQAAAVLDALRTALAAAGTTDEQLVRLHVYLADASSTPVVERLLADRFAGAARPAVTFV